MKKAGTWMLLLSKRLCRRRSFILLCLAVPVAVLFLVRIYQEEEPGIRAVFWAGESLEAQAVKQGLTDYGGGITFYEAASEAQVQEEVMAGRADCGYIIRENSLQEGITEFRKKNTRIADLVRQVLYAQVFTVLSFGEYVEYMAGQVQPGTVSKEQIAESFKKYLHNNSTFSVEYVEEGSVPIPAEEKKAAFPIHKVLLCFVFAAVLCGTVDSVRDREEKRFAKLRNPWAVELLTIGLPFTVSVAISAVCLRAAQVIYGGAAEGTLQHGSLLAYCLLLFLVGYLLNKCFQKYRTLLTFLPFLLLCGIVLLLGGI